jgi:3-methyladenine DNA glycosylase AlkD
MTEEQTAARPDDLERALRALGSPERAAGAKAYLKSDLDFTGTPVPAIRSTVASWYRAGLSGGGAPGRRASVRARGEVLTMAAALWGRPVFECRLSAVLVLTRADRLLEPADLALVENMLRSSGTWALVDGLAIDVVGGLVERYPELTVALDGWVADTDFWLRRSALLALLRPLRRGGGDFDRFGRYADQMLGETEFFVRKAIGWVLRETAKKRPELVAAWLGPRVHRASGVTVREAVKPLPFDLRAKLLAGYREKRPVPL